jgi:hypothetical protein
MSDLLGFAFESLSRELPDRSSIGFGSDKAKGRWQIAVFGCRIPRTRSRKAG